MMGVDSDSAITIIKKIVLISEPLNNMVGVKVKDSLRKGVFLISNVLEKTNKHYGDPVYSLCSYFDFFENPLKDKPTTSDITSNESSSASSLENVMYDWFEYQDVDSNSTRIALKDGIVLIECRNFQDMISLFTYSIADTELKEQIKNGELNNVTRETEDVQSLTIGNFKKIIEILKRKKARKTQKKTGTKSK